MTFDVAVVGLGLMGSAALRHLSQRGVSAIGIGPAEPDVWATHTGPFASHYDSGRVTRRLDARREWAVLASRSIEQYPVIEAASGITFHHPVGHVFVRNDTAGVANQRLVIDELDLPVTIGSTDERGGDFPEFAFPSGWTLLHEPGPAGYIDPRRMAQAQLAVALQMGATVRRTSVTAVRRQSGRYRVECAGDSPVDVERVLIATGPYLNDLLPHPLAGRVVPEAIVLARVTPEEAKRLSGLPTLIYLLDHPLHDDVYLVPPVRYPDGHYYLKLGGSYSPANALSTAEAKRLWMAGNAADEQRNSMREVLEKLLPKVSFESLTMKPCLIADTVHGLPFVDQVEDGLFVAMGGNGHAAKSADAIGALAANLMVSGRWDDPDLAASAFAAVFGEYRTDPGSRHGN
jgi:sarcosine oxidase